MPRLSLTDEREIARNQSWSQCKREEGRRGRRNVYEKREKEGEKKRERKRGREALLTHLIVEARLEHVRTVPPDLQHPESIYIEGGGDEVREEGREG